MRMPAREGRRWGSPSGGVAHLELRFWNLNPLMVLVIQDVLNDEHVGLILRVVEQEPATEFPTCSHALPPILDLALDQ